MNKQILYNIEQINKPFDDNTIMPFGMHKGKHLHQVPDEYLIWLYDNGKVNGKLADYIKINLID